MASNPLFRDFASKDYGSAESSEEPESRTNENGKKIFEPSVTGSEVRWARFYNLTNSKPVFPGRDGILYGTFEAMAAKNKLGYDYFSSQPGSILKNGQKKWHKMLANQANKLKP